jgi:hypothetical protein
LLGCSPAQLVEARQRLLQQLRRGIQHFSTPREAHESEPLAPVVLHDADVA